MITQGKHTLKDLLVNTNIEQILIPEIQRDYVWGKENVTALINSIELDATRERGNRKGIDDSFLNSLTPDQRELIQRTLDERKAYSNIGFIYAYFDPEIIDRYYLIDGQQRITTLYLFLLALSVKASKESYFIQSYFKNETPKVDYKVRETAHDFLLEFIPFILDNGKVEDIKKQSWYYSDYENDKTIQSHINNYIELERLAQTTIIDFNFAENNIELWYFDTDKSEQGEELYIYMNSRGEPVKANENIKAQLLEGLDENKKRLEGLKWEDWQSFFWKHKSKLVNSNADKGFDEFLKWIKIIQFILTNATKTQKEHSDYIKETKQAKKLSIEFLSLIEIERTFEVIKKVVENKNLTFFNNDWLKGETSLADYIRLLPVILYLNGRKNITEENINRFSRFFFNVLKFEDISKNPSEYTSQSLLLINEFNKQNLIDIADIGKLNVAEQYKNILTNEELFKFNLFKQSNANLSREEIEKMIWNLEDFKLSGGSISLILECMNVDCNLAPNNFDFVTFTEYSTIFQTIFKEPDDVLRRALLTIGDYSYDEGYSSSLDMRRYNFGHLNDDWKTICSNKNGRTIVKTLLQSLLTYSREKGTNDYGIIMEDIVSNYIQIPSNGSLTYWLISNSEIFEYCKAKRICISASEVYILAGKNATNYVSLEDMKN
jgi:uncharacterized protein with ParB-like and HNH nuclease domain